MWENIMHNAMVSETKKELGDPNAYKNMHKNKTMAGCGNGDSFNSHFEFDVQLRKIQ